MPYLNKQTRQDGHRAFTLIELLVVISIISVLVSILLPSLASARRSAEAIQCGNYIKQAGIAFQTYAADNKNRLPWYRNDPAADFWNNKIDPYLEDRRHPSGSNFGGLYMTCPSNDNELIIGWYQGTYGANTNGVFMNYIPSSNLYGSARLDDIPEPAKNMLIMDSFNSVAVYWAGNGFVSDMDGNGVVDSSVGTYNGAFFWHDDTANMLFADGHVERIHREHRWEANPDFWGPGYTYFQP